ncbi:MAG TPA: phospholipase D family protein [Blastocatellia bacterium]|nr:phospholipase D family protein [Blastocatellia bacterium]
MTTVILLLLLWPNAQQPASSVPQQNAYGPITLRICFSPEGHCASKIRQEIDQAQKTIFVQAYSLTSSPIAKALIKARKRGVQVEVIIDGERADEKYSQIRNLNKEGVDTFTDNNHAIAHNKVIIIDSQILVTGSLNFSRGADERNAENTIIIRDEKWAEIYAKNYQKHRKHSEIYKPAK